MSGNGQHHHPITPVGTYVMVWMALVIGTILTAVVAYFDFGALNTPIALGIAITKASLVIIMFMGLRYNTPLTKVVAISGFLWLMILFFVGMGDYISRDWLHVAGR